MILPSLPLRVLIKPVTAELGRSDRLLRWELSHRAHSRRDVPATFLESFCGLADPQGTPTAVLEIAREWGVLTEGAAWIGYLRGGHQRRAGYRRRATRGTQLIARWRAIAATTAAVGRLVVILRGDRRICWGEDQLEWEEALTLAGTEWTTWHAENIIRLLARPRRLEVLADLLRQLLRLGSDDVLRDPVGPWSPDVEIDFDEKEAAGPFLGIDLHGPVGAAAAVLASIYAAPASRLAICCEPYCALPFVALAYPNLRRHSFCSAHTGTLRWQWDSRGRPKNSDKRDRHL